MTPAAVRTIAGARLHADRSAIAFCCAAAAVAGLNQASGAAARSVWLAGPMFFCSAIGIALAMLQEPRRHPYLDTNERSAPLFGRELARAKALAPLIAATAASLVYWAAHALSGRALSPVSFALVLACVFSSVLVALNATVLRGSARAVALALAAATVVIAYLLAAFGVALELVFCAVAGFFALREYGESLARYEPDL
jgi:H+/Cl- antiporter ClcA